MLKELEGKTVWQVALVNFPDFSGFLCCNGSTYTVVISKARRLTVFLINTIENLQNKAYLFSIPLFLRTQDEGVHRNV